MKQNKVIIENRLSTEPKMFTLEGGGRDCNHFHNTLRLFGVLPNFPSTTSETMHDYYL